MKAGGYYSAHHGLSSNVETKDTPSPQLGEESKLYKFSHLEHENGFTNTVIIGGGDAA